MDENNGIIVLRERRQIDVVKNVRKRDPQFVVQNNDRYWGLEIDFPAVLDEEFSITTSKQRVIISERIWGILRENGVFRTISDLRARYEREATELKEQLARDKEHKRLSELVMEEARKDSDRHEYDSPDKQRKRRKLYDRKVNRIAQALGISREEAECKVEAEIEGYPYKVEEVNLTPLGPFYNVEQIGGQKVLYFNSAHRFYLDVYNAPGATRRLKDAVETVLWVLAESELDAKGDLQRHYERERGVWSVKLHDVLDRLRQHEDMPQDSFSVDTLGSEGTQEPITGLPARN